MKGMYDAVVPEPDVSAPRRGSGRAAGGGAQTRRDVSPPAVFGHRESGGCIVVCAAGEIDVATAPAFRAALVNAAERSQRLVVDLSAVTFLDCAGLSALATVVRRLRATGDVLHLVGATGIVGRVITLTRLDEAVVVDASGEDALASIAPAAS